MQKKSGVVSLPAGLHLVSRVQRVKANIDLKPNNNNTSRHATTSPLSPATHTSHTPLKRQRDQRQTFEKNSLRTFKGNLGCWPGAHSTQSLTICVCMPLIRNSKYTLRET